MTHPHNPQTSIYYNLLGACARVQGHPEQYRQLAQHAAQIASWEGISAQARPALMECLVNAHKLPEHGFPEITRLCQQAPALKMTYANFTQVAKKVEALLKKQQ